MDSPRLPPDDRRPVLQPPQFGLVALLGAVAALGGLFAITHYFGGLGAALATLFVLCIVAHVVGNAIGTRLRDCGDTPVQENGSPVPHPPRRQKPQPADFAPLSGLRQRSSLGRRMIVITAVGSAVGGLLGYAGVFWLADERTTWPVFALGAAACAVLGAIWTFAAASFLQVTVGEFLHARRNSG